MQRLTTMGQVVPRGMAYRFSPLKGRMVLYSKCQAIAACEPFEYPLSELRDAYNSELENQGIDAYVEACKQLKGTFQDNLIVDCWVSTTESEVGFFLDPVTIAAIIGLLKIVAFWTGMILFLALATAFVEIVFPRSKFYAPDGTVFTDLAAYISYMQNVYNPAHASPYTCMYCGQGFATVEERDAHQAQCPWKEGPPTAEDPLKTVLMVVTVLGVVYVISKIF